MHAAGTEPRRIADSAPVTSRRPLTRRNQHDAAGALAGARRRSDVTRSNGIDAPTHSPLCATMTSSIIPEVDNVSQQRRQRRTITTRPDNNSTYRVAMHNTKTWPISAVCGTFHTPFFMLKRTIRTGDEGRWRRMLARVLAVALCPSVSVSQAGPHEASGGPYALHHAGAPIPLLIDG